MRVLGSQPVGDVSHKPNGKKGKGSPYSVTERRIPELIPVLCSQPARDMSHKPDRRLLLLSTRPAVTPTARCSRAWVQIAVAVG